jgi:hypothetical protein
LNQVDRRKAIMIFFRKCFILTQKYLQKLKRKLKSGRVYAIMMHILFLNAFRVEIKSEYAEASNS